MTGRPHKAFVVCTDDDWRAFRALVVGRGTTVQAELGRLVGRELGAAAKQDERRRSRRMAGK